MAKNNTLNKGYATEEVLRNYFLNMGYYVVRGIKLGYRGHDITDIDLWLYNKNSLLSRERINVDIKDKKRPQAAERILWTKGIQSVIASDGCIVATTDRTPHIREFGQKHGVTVLNGEFLSKLKQRETPNRFTEEEFEKIVTPSAVPKGVEGWYERLQKPQTRLLTELDFSGFNSTLEDVRFFLEKVVTNSPRQDVLLRCLYLTISYLLITLDYIQQKTLFLEESKRKAFLEHGFKYGELGKEGMDNFISIATEMTGTPKKSVEMTLFDSYNTIPTQILSDYFIRNDVLKNLFKSAKEFESLAYSKDFKPLVELDKNLISTVFLMADFFRIDRKKLPY